MKIALLNVEEPGDNKDYNGGFGTTFQVGRSLGARLLQKIRATGEYFPLMSYGQLAGIFKQTGHQVSVVTNDIPRESDLVILHCSLIRHRREMDYIRRIRKETRARIGLIGPFVSVYPDLFADRADFIIQGEPEEVALQIRDQNLPRGVVKSSPVMDLDNLPFPDWDPFPVGEYSFWPTIRRRPFTFIQTGRGCAYACNYCPYKVFGVHRERSASNIAREIEYLQRRYGIRGLMFRDPCFSYNRRRAFALADEILRRKLDVEWGCETRLDRLDIELLESLHRSGLRAIKVGIESADPAILKKQRRKPNQLAHQEKIIEYCDRKGIRVGAFYIVGLEDDTPESVRRTIRYAKRLNTDFASFTICTPIPGTEYYDQKKEDIFEKDWEKFDNFHPVFRHRNLSSDEILAFQEYAIVSYYLRPRFVLKYLKRRLRCY